MPEPKEHSDFHPKDVLLPLVGAMWACASLIYTVTKDLNTMRDKVVTGFADGAWLTLPHRDHMMVADWLPYAISVFIVCIGFGCFALWVPTLLPATAASKRAKPVSRFVACFAFIIIIVWAPGAIRDWRLMQQEVAAAKLKASNPKP